MYLIRFLASFAVFCMFLWISQIDLNFVALHPREISEALILNELCHLHYTNCRLKICIWQLYFYSWLSKVYLKIFLISSPEHALTTPCPWQMTQSAFCLCSYILIGNHVHVKSSGIAPGLANAWLLASRKVCQCPTRGTEKAGKCPSVPQILGPKKRFFFRHFRKLGAIAIWISWPLTEMSG